MRALILLLSVIVVALAASIVSYADKRPDVQRRQGKTLPVQALLGDAFPGEEVVYREETSLRRMVFRVEQTPAPAMMQAPHIVIKRLVQDRYGRLYDDPGAVLTYKHKITRHGWFPLTAPEDPDALDRIWVIRSIRPDKIRVRQKERDCWRVDLIDPALPPEADTVVAWLDPKVPVFGLLKWKRLDETWMLEQAKGGGS